MPVSLSIKFKALLLPTIFGSVVTQVWCFDIDFPISTNYDQLAKLIWSYDISVFGGDQQLTPDARGAPIRNASVRVVYDEPFRLRNKGKVASFIANFVINLSPQSPRDGNEGLAFILAADPSPPAGSEGQWLGIVNASTNGTSQAKILAVEFDTRKNFPDDIDGNHVGLDVNSIFSVVQKPLSGFNVNLSDTADVFVRVEYDGKNISIFVSLSSRLEDQLKSRVIFHPLDLSVLPDKVYVGFSASTCDYNQQLNWVKSWQFHGTDVGDKGIRHLWVWITVAATFVPLCYAGLLFYRMTRRRLNDPEETYTGIEDQLQDFSIAPRAQKFGLAELKRATDNFDPKNRLGKGGFGTVYKGNFMNKEVAVKRISKDSRQGKQEFIAEVTTIGSLHHKNLVKLIGWCYEKRDLLLVYEYMPNGSLDKLIFGDDKFGAMESAPNWERRRNIICGVAEALDYLHNGCEKRVLHRDVKSSNIMLDSNFDAKLGDFGLARTIRRTEQTHHSTREIAGTRGYMAPETFLTRRATAETDVYAFGALVLEVLCGRKPANPDELGDFDGSIMPWAWEFHKRGKIVEAADARIRGQFVEEEMEDLLILGLTCCHPNPHQRPAMNNVLQVLKGEANPPILPYEMPSFVWPPLPPSIKEDTENSQVESQVTDPLTELTGR